MPWRKPLYALAAVGFVQAAGVSTYWLWFDNPAVYYRQELKALNSPRHGEPLLLHSKFCMARDVAYGSVIRTIKNTDTGIVYFLPDASSVAPAGCYDVQRNVDLPGSAPPGNYTYNFSARFEINPLRTVEAHIDPVPFRIPP